MRDDLLRGFHARHGARWSPTLPGGDAVADYGRPEAEYASVAGSVGLIDTSVRGRLALLGSDRVDFLNGQVTQNVHALKPGEGCLAFLVNARARAQALLRVYRSSEALQLEFDAGLTAAVVRRLEQFVIAADVQVVDLSESLGVWTLAGPRAESVLRTSGLRGSSGSEWPQGMGLVEAGDGTGIRIARGDRLGSAGFDLFVPVAAMVEVGERLLAAVRAVGGGLCGGDAAEIRRVELGIPMYGADIDDSNLAPEVGLNDAAVSTTKGCYIGQEVISRIRTYGQVTRTLCRIRIEGALVAPPRPRTPLVHGGKEVGYVTSAVRSPESGGVVGLGYVRREVPDTAALTVCAGDADAVVRVVGPVRAP